MSKHTPGPWRWEGDKMRGAERKLVKTSQHETLHPERAAANRALIAAAPDLLLALRDLVARCDGDEGVRADGSNIDTVWAHAAIAKVEEGDACTD